MVGPMEIERTERLVHIPLPPKVWERTGGSGSRRYTVDAYRDWKALAARHIADSGVPLGYVDPVGVAIGFRPDGIDLAVYPRGPNRPRGMRGDLDNYVKAVLDAAHFTEDYGPPGLIVNDSQVEALTTWFQK